MGCDIAIICIIMAGFMPIAFVAAAAAPASPPPSPEVGAAAAAGAEAVGAGWPMMELSGTMLGYCDSKFVVSNAILKERDRE